MQFQVKTKKTIHRALTSHHDLSNIINIATVNGNHGMSCLPNNTTVNIPNNQDINYSMIRLNKQVNTNSNRAISQHPKADEGVLISKVNNEMTMPL